MDLKQLKDLLKILRAQGVLEFSNGNLQIKLSEEVPSNKSRIKEEILEEPDDVCNLIKDNLKLD